MKVDKILGKIAAFVFLLLLASGIIGDAVSFFSWLLMIDNYQPTISIVGEIAVRILTFVVTYTLVGLFCYFAGWFNRTFMKILYAVVSSILSLLLAYIIWCIEQYILIILIVLSAIAFLSVIIIITIYVAKKKISDGKNEDQD